jgi:hypothetical protein
MGDLYLENGKKAGLVAVANWWLEHYEGIEHMTEGGTTSPETWYTINTILRRAMSKIAEPEAQPTGKVEK